MKKKLIFGLMTTLLLIGLAGCSGSNQSSNTKMNSNQTQKTSSNNMNMSAQQMKNMKQ